MNEAAYSERRVNGLDTDRLRATIGAIKENPALARFRFRARNQWIDGGHTRTAIKNFFGVGREQHARTRPFVLDSDLPALFTGGNKAVNPLELQLTALASCLTTTLVSHAAVQGFDIDSVECAAEGDIVFTGFFGLDSGPSSGFEEIRLRVRLEAPASRKQLDDLVDLGVHYSPVYQMLSASTRIVVSRILRSDTTEWCLSI